MSIAMPHFDAEKVFGLFTEAEAKRARKLMKEQKAGAVRTMIVAAMRRAEHMPLASFVSQKRERIVVRTVPAGAIQPPSQAPAAPSTGEKREG